MILEVYSIGLWFFLAIRLRARIKLNGLKNDLRASNGDII